MRNDVEEAIEKHMRLNHEHPETVGTMDEAAALQELVELGVRLGLEAAAKLVEYANPQSRYSVQICASEIVAIDPRRLVSNI